MLVEDIVRRLSFEQLQRLFLRVSTSGTNCNMNLSRTDDDNHDQIGSNSSTPPGAATPRPDPSDKRLPGILHGYFGQVGEIFKKASLIQSSTAPVSPESTVSTSRPNIEHPGLGTTAGSELPTTPGSPNELVSAEDSLPEFLPQESYPEIQPSPLPQNKHFHTYPTPPDSSSPSPHKELIEESCDVSKADVADDQCMRRGTLSRHGKSADAMTPGARRNTFVVSNPLSSVVTNCTIYAPHLSSPASRHSSTTLNPSNCSRHDHSRSSSASSSFLELKKLTQGMAALVSKKNTPPHTPRALSNDGAHPEKQGLTSLSNSTFPGVPEAPNASEGKKNATDCRESNPENGSGMGSHAAAVGPPKGKLSVTLCEARGLRPSRDPYVVCVFECNEYISKGPRLDETDIDQPNDMKKDYTGGGVSMRRSGSDMGKPLAIPMKSRQSSNASPPDVKELKIGKQVTDPKWGDEAILYARAISA